MVRIVLGALLAFVGGLFLLVVAFNPADFKDAQGNPDHWTAAAIFLLLFVAPGALLIYFGQRARKRRAKSFQGTSLLVSPIPAARPAEPPGSATPEAGGPAPAPDLLDSARRQLEKDMGVGVLAVGLFRRVDTAGCLTYLLGGLLGIAISVPLGMLGALAGGFGVLLAMVVGLGMGQMWAARMLRKAKDVPDNFAIAITAERLHFRTWILEGKANSLRLGPQSATWPRAGLSIGVGDIKMQPAGVPAVATMPTTYSGIGFLLNGQPMLQAQVLSVVPSKGGAGLSVVYGTARNAAFDLLKREQPVLPSNR